MPAPEAHRQAVAGQRVGVRGDLEHPPVAAGGEQDGLGAEHVELAGRQLVGHDAARTAPSSHQQVQHVELVEEPDVALDALLVQRLQDHVAGAVGREARAPDRRLAVVARVPAEPPLVDLALGRAVEREAPVLELDDRVDGLLAHELRRGLVDQVVAALDRVERVPLGVVLLDVRRGPRTSRPGRPRCASGWGTASRSRRSSRGPRPRSRPAGPRLRRRRSPRRTCGRSSSAQTRARPLARVEREHDDRPEDEQREPDDEEGHVDGEPRRRAAGRSPA